jgi:hypothetical protein
MVVPALRRQREAGVPQVPDQPVLHSKFKISLSYAERFCLKKLRAVEIG